MTRDINEKMRLHEGWPSSSSASSSASSSGAILPGFATVVQHTPCGETTARGKPDAGVVYLPPRCLPPPPRADMAFSPRGMAARARFHRALADSEMTASLWVKMLSDIERRFALNRLTFGLMQRLSRTPKNTAERLLNDAAENRRRRKDG